ncbi:MAG: hypothetical protein ONB23_12105 [candidate division KSB1 bacterium]|nr:hypothetical protein [candidate division KSB1 bacterium]
MARCSYAVGAKLGVGGTLLAILAGLPLAGVAQERTELPYRVVAGSPTYAGYGWEKLNDGSYPGRVLPGTATLAQCQGSTWPFVEIELADSLCIGGFDLRSQPLSEISSVLRTTVCDSLVAFYLTTDRWGRSRWALIAGWKVPYRWLTEAMTPRFSFPVIRARRLRIEFHPRDAQGLWLFLNEFKVFSPPPPRIVTHWLSDAVLGKDYTDTLRVLNLQPPMNWISMGGIEGMSLDPHTGAVRWCPSAPGLYRFPVMVVDALDPSRMDTAIVYVRCLEEKVAAVFGDARYSNSTRDGMVWILKSRGASDGFELESIPLRKGVATVPAYSARGRNFYVLAGDSLYALTVHEGGSSVRGVLQIYDPQLNTAGSLLLSANDGDGTILAGRSGDAGLWIVNMQAGKASRQQPFSPNPYLVKVLAGTSRGRGIILWYRGLTPFALQASEVFFDGICRLDADLQDAAIIDRRLYVLTRSPISSREKPGVWVTQLGNRGEISSNLQDWEFVPLDAPYLKGVIFPLCLAPWPAVSRLLVAFSFWDTLLALDANTLKPVGMLPLDSSMVRRDIATSPDSRTLYLADSDNHKLWVYNLGELAERGLGGPLYGRYWSVGTDHDPSRIAVGTYSPAQAEVRLWAVAGGAGDTVRVLPILRAPEHVCSAELTVHYDTTWISYDTIICSWNTFFVSREPGKITLRVASTWTSPSPDLPQLLVPQEILLADLRFRISPNARFGAPLEFMADRVQVLLHERTREVAVGTFGAAVTYVGSGLGDLNHDGLLTLLDVQTLSYHLVGKIKLGIEDSVLADLNKDHRISLEDLWLLLAQIGSPASQGGLAIASSEPASSAPDEVIERDLPMLQIRSAEPLFALYVRLSPGMPGEGLHLRNKERYWLQHHWDEKNGLAFVAVAQGSRPLVDGNGLLVCLPSVVADTLRVQAVGIGPRGVESRVEAVLVQPGTAVAQPQSAGKASVSIVPNPANEGAHFVVTLPEASSLTITMFDTRGRRVGRLHQARLPAGTHRIHFAAQAENGQVLPSGVYLCRVETDFGRWFLKFTLLR